MGSLLSFCKGKKNTEINNSLIREIYCPKCKITYISNYEYNKHIVTCNESNNQSNNESYGDL